MKGKRACPARGGDLICSKCCGTKRRVEIQCPDDCHFLHGADPNWQSAARQKQDALFLSRYLRLREAQVVFVLFLHHLLVSRRARFRSVADDDLKGILGAVRKTLETRTKGIVYEHRTDSPHLDVHVSWLASVLAARADLKNIPEVSDRDVREVLEAVELSIADHRARGSGLDYLDTAEQVLQSSLAGAPPIELPPELDEPPPDLIVSP